MVSAVMTRIRRKAEPPPTAAADRERARIVTRARTHFFTHGFRTVTMSDLAAEMGMSKKTLYVHFPSKTALLQTVIDDKLAAVQNDLVPVIEDDRLPFAGRLQRLLATLRMHMGEIHPAFVRDIKKEAPELFARIQQGRRQLIQRGFGKLLEEGRRAGDVRRDIPVKLLIEMLIGTVDAMVVPARMDEPGITPRTALTQIVTVFLEGVLVRRRVRKQ
jgi:AcrR family transcriptional regulator